jgi:hypothetical protein
MPTGPVRNRSPLRPVFNNAVRLIDELKRLIEAVEKLIDAVERCVFRIVWLILSLIGAYDLIQTHLPR